MQLVEQHIISKSDPRFAVIDAATFKSKNLYNAAFHKIKIRSQEASDNNCL
jgi:putative transposase